MAAPAAASSQELQNQGERGGVLRTAVAPREAPTAEAPHAEAETGDQKSSSEEEQPPRGEPRGSTGKWDIYVKHLTFRLECHF